MNDLWVEYSDCGGDWWVVMGWSGGFGNVEFARFRSREAAYDFINEEENDQDR